MPSHSWDKQVKLAIPEILKAIDAEYASDRKFISTKYVCERIMDNPQNYPFLSAKSVQHVRTLISLCLLTKLKMKPYSNQSNCCGRIFIRKVKNEQIG